MQFVCSSYITVQCYKMTNYYLRLDAKSNTTTIIERTTRTANKARH